MSERLIEAIALLRQCASQLARTGGMLNKDLARDVTKFAALAEQELKE